MTEFDKQLIRRLIEGFEAELRVSGTVSAACAESPSGPGPSTPVPPDGQSDRGPSGPGERALFLALHAARAAEDPEGAGGVAVLLGRTVYYARDDWRVGVIRDVKAL